MPSSRAPDWTLEEFDTLINDAGWTDEELARRLPQRTPGAVGVVRAALHQFHQTGGSPMLSRMMQQYVTARRGSLTCAVCKTRF
jgi:hypothetical protein